MNEDTSRLLGLAGLAVTRVEDGPDGPVVYLVTADDQARRCPHCGTRARRSKGWRVTRPRDLAVGGRHPRLVWRKHRWRCDESGCPRKSFTETVAQVPARKRLTLRLRTSAGAAIADGGRTIVQSARDHHVSWPVAAAAFATHAAAVLPAQPDPVQVLGIDEIRRGRPKWVWDETTGTWQTTVDRWHVGFVDLSGGQGLLGQVEGRNAAVVCDWLAERTQAWRDAVRFVAIDMCTIFKSAVRQALPGAVLVADHFHIVQLANQTVTEIRRRVTVQVRGRRGRKGNREWELRNRLTRNASRMHGDHVADLEGELKDLPPRIGTPILAAWNAKEDLLDLLALARTHPNRGSAIPVLPPMRPIRPARAGTTRHHGRNLVARNPGIHPHRHHQRRLRRHQPGHQNRRPRRLRLPQPRQPAITHPLRHHSPSQGAPQPPLTS
ncbi:zinc-finger of transposase IS204/IS1001/IS1096/IS1165 [Micromonospora rhizosphaerae]|uniref:Zinc-finger of transposase IS204/IS1001/IS1096/IS1165 n=1 Tax=Micromonospora rhizosphaerae TaxID=568872 RepID=A0A1C6RSB3_9ACTN|nr:zinc-finger of transposase IS204/IS1001/IS1096/IS1165 [Micromonospora rhizosphaerae]